MPGKSPSHQAVDCWAGHPHLLLRQLGASASFLLLSSFAQLLHYLRPSNEPHLSCSSSPLILTSTPSTVSSPPSLPTKPIVSGDVQECSQGIACYGQLQLRQLTWDCGLIRPYSSSELRKSQSLFNHRLILGHPSSLPSFGQIRQEPNCML